LRSDVGGERDVELRRLFRDQRADAALVLRVAEREQKADGDRGDAVGDEPADRTPRRLLVELRQDAPVEEHALRDLLGKSRWDERPGAFEKEIVRRAAVRTALLTDLVDAAEPFGDQQTGARTVLLEDRVGADGRAVREKDDVGRALAGTRQVVAQSADDPVGFGAACRGDLEDLERAARLVEHDEVGERSAGVDGDSQAFHASTW
jgi:hypothetical protein